MSNLEDLARLARYDFTTSKANGLVVVTARIDGVLFTGNGADREAAAAACLAKYRAARVLPSRIG